MFDVGFWEVIVIFGLGLMILGPERLPRVAAQLGRWAGRARRAATQFRDQIEREVHLQEMADKLKADIEAAAREDVTGQKAAQQAERTDDAEQALAAEAEQVASSRRTSEAGTTAGAAEPTDREAQPPGGEHSAREAGFGAHGASAAQDDRAESHSGAQTADTLEADAAPREEPKQD